MKRPLLASLVVLALAAACGQPAKQDSDAEFMSRLTTLCGQAFEGEIVSKDPEDDEWRTERIVMHVRDCSPQEVRIPLHVGDDRSRVWVLHNDGPHLALHHAHTHEDGSPDAITWYGGAGNDQASASRMAFPADDATKALFDSEGIPQSKDNTWAIEVRPSDNLFAYEMKRPKRFFRIEFDTSQPVAPPPAPWGNE